MTTYSEFRNRFKSAEEFRRAYGRLTEEEARALIEKETAPTHIKAAMVTTWQMAKREEDSLCRDADRSS